jgi:hypothetical protein
MQPQCGRHAERESIQNLLLFYCHWFLPLPAFVLPGPMHGHTQRPAHVRGGAGGRRRRSAARGSAVDRLAEAERDRPPGLFKWVRGSDTGRWYAGC